MHSSPKSEPACVVPPTPSTSAERGNRLRTSRAPLNGVAASSVSLISRIGGTVSPETLVGMPGAPAQLRQGAVYQALAQVSNGARRCTSQLSEVHFVQLLGQAASVHWTPR